VIDFYKKAVTLTFKMKNLLHFGKIELIPAKEAGEPADSGNGYYSYAYYKLPYSGHIGEKETRTISGILHKRHYNYPFTSLGSTFRNYPNEDKTGGYILYSVTYHHGD
jgi:hypothetical protein